jgi:hypothetical protein
MNESDFRSQMVNMLRRSHFWTFTPRDLVKCPVCGTELFPQMGTPDFFAWQWYGSVVAIECKVFKRPGKGKEWGQAGFPLAEISVGQRAWMEMASRDSARHIYIAIGTVHGRAGARTDPRRSWLVPWSEWSAMEEMLVPIQKTLPLIVRPGLNKMVQEQDISAMTSFSFYELNYVSRVGWVLPARHPLFTGIQKSVTAFQQEWTRVREDLQAQWGEK